MKSRHLKLMILVLDTQEAGLTEVIPQIGILSSLAHELGQTLRDSEGQGSWQAAAHGIAKSQTQLSD